MSEIKLKFDVNHKPIAPTVVLATRSCNKLGTIAAEDLTVKGSLKNGYEISFIANKETNPNWDEISDLRLVWVPEWDIWFEISVKVNETSYLYKDVLGTSLGEAELSQIIIRNTEINTENDIARSDYKPTIIYNFDDSSASLMHRLMEKAPHYKLIHIDKSLSKLQRTFSFNEKSLRDCLNEIATEIDALLIIHSGSESDGSIQRGISLYDLKAHCNNCGHRPDDEDNSDICAKCGSTDIVDGYGEDSGIFVCSENLSDNIELETNIGEVKNCFKLEAGDDTMTAAVMACCPNGSGYLWYVSDETRADMSEALRAKLAAYDNALLEAESREFDLSDFMPSNAIAKYNAIAEKYDKSKLNNITGYTNLQNAIYDIIDFGLYVEHSMMPNVGIPTTTATEQMTYLIDNLSSVSVQRLMGLSSITASSYISQAVRAIIDPRYSVEINNATLNGTIWGGDITITSYSDENDTASYDDFSVELNENYTEFVKKLIDRILNTKEHLEFDIVALFKLDNSEFANKIKEYGLIPLQSFFDSCQACLNILIERGGTDINKDLGSLYSEYYSKLGLLQNEIKVRESEAKVIADMQERLIGIVGDVHNELDFEKYLGSELWMEFSAYHREDTYKNENYISDGLDNAQLFSRAMEFIKTAKKEITKAGTLQHSITSNLYNLMAMPEFKDVAEKFKLGNWIRIRIDNKMYLLRLIEYRIRFDSLETIEVTYSDVMYDGTVGQDIDDIKSLQDSYKSMASSYGSVSKQASKGNDANNQLHSWVSDGLEVSKTRFLDDAVNQNITWDKNGMLFRKYDEISDDHSPEQLRIINSTIAVTDDNWETVKTAIGGFDYLDPVDNTVKHSYGINAELLIGKLILGEGLGLYNETNSMSFDTNGLKITNNNNSFAVNPNDSNSLFCLSNKNGKILWVDENGSLHLHGDGAGLDLTANSSITKLSNSISIIPSSQVFVKTGDEEIYSPETITLTAISSGVLNYQWYKDDEILDGQVNSILTVSPTDIQESTSVFKVVGKDINDNTYTDYITIAKLENGTQGQDGYTVLLSDGYIEIPTRTNYHPEVSSEYSCKVRVFEGLTELSYSNDYPSLSDGQFYFTTSGSAKGILVINEMDGGITLQTDTAQEIDICSEINIDITLYNGKTMTQKIRLHANMDRYISQHESNIKQLDNKISLSVKEHHSTVPICSADDPSNEWTDIEKTETNVGYLWYDTRKKGDVFDDCDESEANDFVGIKRWNGSGWDEVLSSDSTNWSSITQSLIEQTAKSIHLSVKDGESGTKLVLSSKYSSFESPEIKLKGVVTVEDLSATGTTVIDGSRIKSGTIDASMISGENLQTDYWQLNQWGLFCRNDLSSETWSGIITLESQQDDLGAYRTLAHSYFSSVHFASNFIKQYTAQVIAVWNPLGQPGSFVDLGRAAASSQRYKIIDRELTTKDIESLYNIKVVFAKYKDDYLSDTDERFNKNMPMFIAEDVDEHFPIAVDHINGQAENWNFRIMIPAMFQMIKDQKSRIDTLEEELKNLKGE